MFTRSNFELKVGIFIFIGTIILSVIVFSIGNFYSIKRGYTLSIIFNFANGINVGAPVRYAGVEVGEVQDIQVYFDEKENNPMVRLIVWVLQNTWINEDAKATINTLGLLGEKYLEITPGTRETKLLGKGDTLRGQDPVSTEEFTRGTKETLLKIDSLVESINKFVGDEEVRASFKNTILNFESLAESMNKFVGDEEVKTSLKNTILNFESLSVDLKNHPWKLLYKSKEEKKKK